MCSKYAFHCRTRDIHVTDYEVFLIVSGTAGVTLGGDVTDKKTKAKNQFRGLIIVGGTNRSVSAADMIRIPRGTAHQMNPGTGQILYIVIKMMGSRRRERPFLLDPGPSGDRAPS